MKRAAAMSAASVLCLLWAGGCSSLGLSDKKPEAASTLPAKPADADPGANSDVASLSKNLPGTMAGEIKRAKLLREKGDYAEAEHSLAQLMLVAPDDGIVVGEYGKVLEQEGRSQEALSFLARAVQLQPRDWTLYSALGIAYDQVDKHADARAAYESALRLQPGEASVLNNYAVSRMLAGDYAGAQRLLAQASARGGDNPKIALNAEKLAAFNPAPTPPPVAVQPVAAPAPKVATKAAAVAMPASAKVAMPMPVTVASLKAPAPAVVMQRVPVDPLAPKHISATSVSTAPLPSSLHPMAVHAPLNLVAAKLPGTQVVMQRVPVDPLAGPVAARKPASVHKAAPAAAKPEDDMPSLRTAADTDK